MLKFSFIRLNFEFPARKRFYLFLIKSQFHNISCSFATRNLNHHDLSLFQTFAVLKINTQSD